jgi:DNA helicase IV
LWTIFMAHPDVPAEQVHVDHAYRRLEQMRSGAAAMVADAFGERGGTFQSFTERDIRVRNGLGRLEQLQIGSEPLVFGRIDHQPSQEGPGGDSFHIGRIAVSDEDQEPLVVDWRAPIAEPFYRATGAHAMGLRRRRHFLTEGQKVLDLEDELFDRDGDSSGLGLGLAGPQVLLAALGRSRTGRMHDIVATVQREQDEIIRSPLPGILVVQGGPGTGKTAVALHRAAYLLYTHRFPLESQGVLVLGPNTTFLRYIEHVLPSLGESGVQLSTIGRLVPDVTLAGTDDLETERLKGDARMAGVVAQAVRDRQRPLRRAVEIPYGRMTLRLTPEASAHLVSATRRRPGSHNARRRTLEQLLWRELADQVRWRLTITGGGSPDPLVDEDGEAAVSEAGGQAGPAGTDPLGARAPSQAAGDGAAGPGAGAGTGTGTGTGRSVSDDEIDPVELGRELRRQPEVAEALDRMWPLLTPAQLLHDLFGAPPLVELATRGRFAAGDAKRLERPRAARAEEARWTAADLPLLDEARALLGPLRRHPSPDEAEIRTFGHIVVDEAQDLTPMQLRMLARRSLSGSMTLVGDIAQATGARAPQGWRDIVAHLPANRPWRQVDLTVNYRTPAEVMALAHRVLDATGTGLPESAAVRVSGEEPRIVAVPAGGPGAVQEEAARLLAERGERRDTVGVIVPPSWLAGTRDALAAVGLTAGVVGAGALDEDISLLAVQDAKGLEFDDVVVLEPGALVGESPQGLRSLYVALTRPTQRLLIIHAEPLPPALA